MPNHLIKESSPYLLQHANNPVEWYAWGEEALRKAREEDKPILVSIGYSACHWCHVMERESFEDEETAEIMNAGFINIKIDREERPDLDHIYMDAVQAMTGSGGWPLNVFLTPDGKPFYGGTYFPPVRAFNRPSWKEVLKSIRTAFLEKRAEIQSQSEGLVSHLIEAGSFGLNQSQTANFFNKENLHLAYENIMKLADHQEGGFGKAPKFPQTFPIQFLLRYYYHTREEKALMHACKSIDKMIQGGIYDQVGGGFARYATDDEWLVPHFEKMLYDNALLITVISEVYQLTGLSRYRDTVAHTFEFISREMLSPEGGFYAALDADSEGEEGKYYTWTRKEIEVILQDDADIFCEYYDISNNGNWEGKNILRVKTTEEEFAKKKNLNSENFKKFLIDCRKKILQKRQDRIPPSLDDKILLGWNALMIIACCKAYAAFGMEEYKQLAIDNIDFLWTKFKGTGIHHFHHSYKNGRATIPAFLDDYAYLIDALLQLQEITGNFDYLQKANELTSWVLENFIEEKTGYFFFTHKEQGDIILRKKEVYDGAIPSGNAVMASNLLQLSVLIDNPNWREMAVGNCLMLGKAIVNYPVSFGVWATLLQTLTYGVNEIVITGTESQNIVKDFLERFIPNRVFQSATTQNNQFPLLKDKPISQTPLIFLCREYACQSPVVEVSELIRLLETV
ncbi:MAG: thioredoxin domain-containing protein [Bacteroidetes bacterium]|nr:thioredoxin domain-containing protein [Bacteroidota bacterium]